MKKLMMLLAACLLMASLAACGKKDNANNGETGTPPAADGKTDMDNTGTANQTTGTDTETGSGETLDDNRETTVENSDEIAEAVSSIDGVDHANVLKMNDSVYVGATLKEGTDSSKELEDQIADKAKEASTDADKVYVSTNPDFAKEIDDYSDKIRSGKPVEGLFEEIGDAMSRMFPDAH